MNVFDGKWYFSIGESSSRERACVVTSKFLGTVKKRVEKKKGQFNKNCARVRSSLIFAE